MVSEVIEVVEEYLIPRHQIWEVLIQPRMYPRLFTGIASCERVDTITGHDIHDFRIGRADDGFRTLPAMLTIGRRYEGFDLRSVELSAFVSVVLHSRGATTKVIVRYIGARRLDPALNRISDSDIANWTRRGLRQAANCALGMPTSVVEADGHSLLYRVAAGLRHPNRRREWRSRPIALVDDAGRIPRKVVRKHTRVLASALSDLEVESDCAVGLLARNHAVTVECVLAARMAGVDLIVLCPDMPRWYIRQLVDRRALSVVFVDSELESKIPQSEDVLVICIDGIPQTPGGVDLDDLRATRVKRGRARLQGRLVLHTGGVGGRPREVVYAPDPTAAARLLTRLPLRVGETVLVGTPLSHWSGIMGVDLGLAARATVIVSRSFDAQDLLRQIQEHSVRTVIVNPSMLEQLLGLPLNVLGRYDLSSLSTVVSCGASLAAETAVRFMETFGRILYNIYGSTEVPGIAVAAPEDLSSSPATVGMPLPDVVVAVVGANEKPVPRGRSGCVRVRRPSAGAENPEAALPDSATQMLDTGDYGYIDMAGRLFIEGRADEIRWHRGEMIVAARIERVLETLPQVLEAAVVWVPDHEFGARLTAFVVGGDTSQWRSEDIRRFVEGRLGRAWRLDSVVFVNMLPRNQIGVVLKALLRPVCR